MPVFGTDGEPLVCLLAGCAAALWWRSDKEFARTRLAPAIRNHGAWAALVLVPFLVTAENAPGQLGPGRCLFPLIVLAMVVLILAALTAPGIRRALSVAPLVVLGRLSYGIYLWHLIVFAMVGRACAGTVAHIGLSIVVTLAIAGASYRYLERPLRARLSPVTTP